MAEKHQPAKNLVRKPYHSKVSAQGSGESEVNTQRFIALFLNPLTRIFLVLLFLIGLYYVLYKIYIPRVTNFGCFDDCFNFMGGYFLLKGKVIYSQFFFNHQPGMAYVSFLIQYFTHPINVFDLVLKHRQFVLLFAFVMDAFLIWRFAVPGAAFVLFYEFSKYYLFGDRFLAEGLIVYPLVYLFGSALSKLRGRFFSFEYILTPIAAWFVIWMREPYILAAGVMYMVILITSGRIRLRVVSFGIFALLLAVSLGTLPLGEYISNVITLNASGVLSTEAHTNNVLGVGLLHIFFYPFYILFTGENNFFHHILICIDVIFLFSSVIFIKTKKQYHVAFFTLVFLGLANIRYIPVGQVFYSSFHMLPWYALFLFTTFVLVKEVFTVQKRISYIGILFLLGVFIALLFSKNSYLREKLDPQKSLVTNYNIEIQAGGAIRDLSTPSQTLFLDDFDDLVYWSSGLQSPYAYTWYTSFMPQVPKYARAKVDMFRKDPPDFYFGSCPGEVEAVRYMPGFAIPHYTQLFVDGHASCLWVRNDVYTKITEKQWSNAKEFLYTKPEKIVEK